MTTIGDLTRALLRRILGRQSNQTGYAAGGYTGPGSEYQPAAYLHHGEYVYRASDGTFWHVQRHTDGDTRTELSPADFLEGDDE